jgi:hypothetical protein
MIVLDHGWEELLRKEVVRECVDVEREADVGFGGVEDALSFRDAGVVDQDGWVAEVCLDL